MPMLISRIRRRDARGRKQYRYHAKWRVLRDESKFARMLEFGAALPKLRERVEHDLGRAGLPSEKVLATVVRLVEITFIRVGNEEYAKPIIRTVLPLCATATSALMAANSNSSSAAKAASSMRSACGSAASPKSSAAARSCRAPNYFSTWTKAARDIASARMTLMTTCAKSAALTSLPRIFAPGRDRSRR